ncbi:MAG: tRNA pseudouridine(38-40) synthase TruA [Thermoguttaceae bacterium]|nr:tRNA pseudouridine(38-40) synthase TruA [Thermoguttaceae bacterium]
MDPEEPLTLSRGAGRVIRLEVAYDGAPYSGWQVQPSQRVATVQGALQDAVAKVTGRRAEVVGSGRTDAGVHAVCQTAAFRTDSSIPPERMAAALNTYLPPSIRVLRSRLEEDGFHPIRDAIKKRYRYLLSDGHPADPLLAGRVWTVLRRLDLDRMIQAARHIPGTRDFAAFQSAGSPRVSTVRTIFDLTVTPLDWPRIDRTPFLPLHRRIIAIEVEADGFLYNMVRSIAGTLAAFAQGRAGFENPDDMAAVIASRDRARAGATAPPHGLYLLGALYPGDTL